MILSKKLILGSGSPRRKEILENAGFRFEVEVKVTEEDFPAEMPPGQVPVYLAEKKRNEFGTAGYADKIILCADTVVILDGQILNKPRDRQESAAMLGALSGRRHTVVTGIALKCGDWQVSVADHCDVYFEPLSTGEIDYYIDECRPFDKAGSYGIQDFIGMTRISRLEGSFYTVMGLPVHLVYEQLKPFVLLK